MSGRRPPPPRSATDDGRDGVHDSRSYPSHNSCNAQKSSPYPATRPSPAMKSHKRPTESRSRGNSPLEKRACLPKRTASLHDRYADTRNPTSIPSPPASRRSSTTTQATKNPTGPRSDHHRSILQPALKRTDRRQDQTRDAPVPSHNARIMSPRSMESGGSIPVHHVAPTVPSMLPLVGESAYAARIQQHDAAASAEKKSSIDTLRKLKATKRAVASNIKATSMQLDTSTPAVGPIAIPHEKVIKDLQFEIAQLKEERLAMAQRLDTLEQQKSPLQTTEPAELQTKVEEVVELFKTLKRDHVTQIQSLQVVLDRLATVESSLKDMSTLAADVSSLQGCKESQPTTTELKELLDNVAKQKENLQAATIRYDKLDVTVQGLLSVGNDVALIQTWKQSQPTETEIRALVAEQVAAKLDTAKKVIQASSDITKTALTKHMDDRVKALSEKHTELVRHINKHIGPTKQAYDRTERSILDRIEEVEVGLHSLWRESEDADRLTQDRFSKFSKETGQVKNFQSEQSKFASRLDSFEKTVTKVVLTWPTLSQSPKPTQTNLTDEFVEKTTSRLSQLKKQVQELSQQNGSESPPSTVTQIEARLKHAEEQLRKLVNEETHVKPDKKIIADLAKFNEYVQAEFTTLYSELEKFEGDALNLDTRVSVLQDHVPRLFDEKFDPLQQTIMTAVAQIDQNNKVHVEKIAAMQNSLSDLRIHEQKGQNSAPSAAEDTTLPKQDIEHIRSLVFEERVIQDRAISDLKSQLAAKADAAAMIKHMDAFRITLRNLHDQYANITTDDLHQKMVHWFLQMYPSNNASTLQQFAAMKQEMASLQSWTQSHSQEFQALLSRNIQSGISSEAIEKACNIANNAATTAQEALTQVDGQKAATHGIEQLVQRLEAALIKLNEVNEALVRPNEALLPKLGELYITVAETQQIIEDVNANTAAVASLPIEWTFDLRTIMKEPPTNGPNGDEEMPEA